MKLFKKMKDGGLESTVTGYWLIEWKPVLSIVLLRFDGDSREAFHTHAFNCFSWVVKGKLHETMLDGREYEYPASIRPFLTTRKDFHKVDSITPVTYVFSVRGPWLKKWYEYLPKLKKYISLTDGRKIVG